MSGGEFSVCQFFKDGTHEYVRRYVNEVNAVRAFSHYTNNVAVRIGLVARVIITDGGDNTVAEWTHNKGLVWPKKEQVK